MLNELIQHIDYDIWEDRYNEDTAEYGQDVDLNFDELIDIVEEFIDIE